MEEMMRRVFSGTKRETQLKTQIKAKENSNP